VTFHSCNTSFAVDLSGITPKPTFAKYPDLQLFSTVFHVWGKLNRTFDRNPQGDNLLDYFDQYVKWSDPSRPNFLQVFMESPGLINGYYNVSARCCCCCCCCQLESAQGASAPFRTLQGTAYGAFDSLSMPHLCSSVENPYAL
jgi:hypothetical protein